MTERQISPGDLAVIAGAIGVAPWVLPLVVSEEQLLQAIVAIATINVISLFLFLLPARWMRKPKREWFQLSATLVGFVGAFSTLHYAISQSDPQAFSEQLSYGDAVYFTLTTLSTTGFGDIAPRTGEARLAVSCQLAVDVILFTVVISILVGRLAAAWAKATGGAPPDAD